jgi:signal transduction histidine kinase
MPRLAAMLRRVDPSAEEAVVPAAAGRVARPPRLVLWFALSTALALSLAAVAILWFLREDAIKRAEEDVAARARSLAYTTLRDTLAPSDFDGPVTAPRQQTLDEVFVRRVLVEGGGVLRVNLVSPGGTVTYSNTHTLRGTLVGDTGKLATAMRGRTVLEETRLDEGEGNGPETIAAYVPVRLTGGVRPSGVLQVYEDYGPVAREIRSAVNRVATILMLALLMLYAALFPILRRVTKGLEAHAELEAEQRALTAQNERLRELDRLKDDFVSSVSHELRTPLTSIRGYLEMMREANGEPLTPKQKRFLEVVDRNADRLLGLVGELLLMAQLDADGLGLSLGDVELHAIAQESVEAARPLADQKGIALKLDAQAVRGVHGDRDRLVQLLDNLVSNAVKFTPEGGRVDVRVFASNAHAQIEVSDTGIGIPVEAQGHVFDRFVRGPNASANAIPGTGLGLAIAKAIVHAHRGRIAVESEEGKGSTFRVELPLEQRQPVEPAAA